MANESNKELTSVWTPANIVTCVRIVFIPVFMIVSALSHTSVAGTDWSTFDGPLAAAVLGLWRRVGLVRVHHLVPRAVGERPSHGRECGRCGHCRR